MRFDRKLIFEDGREFYGYGFGARVDRVCEIVFNTSMAGYQEILSDPSYTDQAVVMSYPLIGSYGIPDEDFESRCIAPSALIVREVNENPSNFRATSSVGDLLAENNIPGLFGADTRTLVRAIRDHGTCRVLLTDADTSAGEGIRRIQETPVPRDAVRRRSCARRWYSRTSNPRWNVVVIDCGLKLNIIRMLNENKCNVTVVPFSASGEEILALEPDGVLISNGPGDPADVPEVVETLKTLMGKVSLFGICLGHQILARASGAETYKLRFGHRGGNHPVMDLASGHVFITSQNHSYAVDEASLAGTDLKVTHVNLLDRTVEGLESRDGTMFSVQFHPESAPGPRDGIGLFRHFTEMMDRQSSR